jgi:hypothetical protein
MSELPSTPAIRTALRTYAAQRIEALRSYRLPWWAHWAALAEMFLPRRYRWFVTPNNFSRGTPINGQIVDETGVLAARTLATGLLANLTSPTKPWFRFGIAGMDIMDEGPIAEWLAECAKRQLEVYAESNIYNVLGTCYHDMAVFGSAALIQYEDPKTVVRFYNPCLGEFFFGLDNRLTIDTLGREYTYTVKETVDEFGLDNVSDQVATMYRQGGSSLDIEVVIQHLIEPNFPVYQSGDFVGLPLPSRFSYREVYWEQASAQGPAKNNILRIKGFLEKPFAGLRWDVTSNDAYGRSPGMDALPAVRQLQIEQRRKAEAIDKMVRPPMVGSVSMKNEPMDIMPGGVTYTADPKADGFKPAYTVEPRIAELMEDLREVQNRVKAIFFNDLFSPIMDNSKVQTATWVEAVEQEKLLLLGPVVERTESEGLDEILNRTFNIMSRRGLFPDPPPELEGKEVTVQYISILAAAQRAASTAAIERVFMFAGNLVAVVPGVMDKLNADEAIDQYADLLNVPPQIVRALKEVIAIRADRQAAEAQAAALTTGATLASGAKTLSETQVGGGQNALEMMIQ